jgi:nicotinamidase-related amidase
MAGMPRSALIVVDLQRGFDDPVLGPRDNPDCDRNVAALVAAARGAGDTLVLVRHDSVEPESPLHPDRPGNAFKAELDGTEADLLVRKQVHSAFHGDVDLLAWLQEREIDTLTICGIQTNMCCETTARIAGNLGYRVRFAIDATHTFDESSPFGAPPVTAAELSRATAATLDGNFAEVVKTASLL